MSTRKADYEIVEYNEDGTRTVKTEYTYTPATKKQQAAAVAGLLALTFAPIMALSGIATLDRYVEKREARKAAKAEEEKTD